MRKNLYQAFTLVEMLIVMGILIILMAVGITAGRFAINRANDVAHQNAVDQIYTALQAYYTDNREFPTECDSSTCNPQTLIGTSTDNGLLWDYLDQGSFDGGTEATFMYFVEATQGQTVLVCVTLGGSGDSKERGVYCNGNGFGSSELDASITQKTNDYASTGYAAVAGLDSTATNSDWNSGAWSAGTEMTYTGAQ